MLFVFQSKAAVAASPLAHLSISAQEEKLQGPQFFCWAVEERMEEDLCQFCQLNGQSSGKERIRYILSFSHSLKLSYYVY